MLVFALCLYLLFAKAEAHLHCLSFSLIGRLISAAFLAVFAVHTVGHKFTRGRFEICVCVGVSVCVCVLVRALLGILAERSFYRFMVLSCSVCVPLTSP